MASKRLDERERALFDQIVAEQMQRPLAWVPLKPGDVSGRKARRLVARQGWEGFGRHMALRGRLAAEEGHRFDVGDAEEAALLAEDLGTDVEGLRSLLADLGALGLVDPDLLAEGRVACAVVDECAMRFARKVAYGRIAGAKGGRPKKKDEDDEEGGAE